MEVAAREVNSHHQLMYHREENRHKDVVNKVATHHKEVVRKAAEVWAASVDSAVAWAVSDNP